MPSKYGWSWVAAVLGLLMTGALLQYAFVEGDTSALLDHTDGILRCVRGGRWGNCPEGGKFPLLQLLLTLPLRSMGYSQYTVGLWLARANTIAYLGVLAISWRLLRARSRIVAAMAVLVLADGLLLHYASRSFAEMAAAFLTLAFAASWLRGNRVLVGAMGLLAGLSKETAFPFLLFLGLVCAIARHPESEGSRALWSKERRRILTAAGGIAIAILLSAGLNWFRFGKPYNLAYLDEATFKPAMIDQLSAFAALWISPNAGLLFFWPSFVAVLVSVPFALRRHPSTRPWRATISLGGIVLLLMLITALCARWWAPFGWWAWGQRLMIPWLPAALLVLCFSYATQLETLIAQLFSTPWRAAYVTIALIVLALPHVASIFRSAFLIRAAFEKLDRCPPEMYFRCLRAAAWTERPPLLHAYQLLIHPFVRLRALLYSGLIALAGAYLYRLARSRSTCTGQTSASANSSSYAH